MLANSIRHKAIIIIIVFLIDKHCFGQSVQQDQLKWIYTGTNKTISEALYDIDKLDGKVGAQHITVKYIPSDKPNFEGPRAIEVRFIDKGDNLYKKVTYNANLGYQGYMKVAADLTVNGQYIIIYKETPKGTYEYYYNYKGDLLWKTDKAFINYTNISPDGEYFVIVSKDFTNYPNELNKTKDNSMLILNKWFKVTAKYDLSKYISDEAELGDWATVFSPSGNYFSIQMPNKMGDKLISFSWLVFNRKGELATIQELPANSRIVGISDGGHLYTQYGKY